MKWNLTFMIKIKKKNIIGSCIALNLSIPIYNQSSATPSSKVCSWPSKDKNSPNKSLIFGGLWLLYIVFRKSDHHDMISPPRRGLRVYLIFIKSSRSIGDIQNATSWECHHDVVSIFFFILVLIQIPGFQLPASFLLRAYLLPLQHIIH